MMNKHFHFLFSPLICNAVSQGRDSTVLITFNNCPYIGELHYRAANSEQVIAYNWFIRGKYYFLRNSVSPPTLINR